MPKVLRNMSYAVQRPDSQNDEFEFFNREYDNCLKYVINYYKGGGISSIEEDNAEADFHGWQIVLVEMDEDGEIIQCHDVIGIYG